MKKQRGRFNATTIYKTIVERQASTIEEEARNVQASKEYFEKTCIRALGMQKWNHMKKVSQEIEKRRLLEEGKKVQDGKNTDSSNPPQDEKVMLQRAYEMKERLDEKVKILTAEEETLMEELGVNSGKIAEFQAVIAETEKSIKEAKTKSDELSQKLKDIRYEISSLEEKKGLLQYKIEELEGEKVYLIAPNFNGNIPKGGVAISTMKLSSSRKITEEIPEGIDLMKEPTFAEFLDSNMESKEFADVLQFARLCIKYSTSAEVDKVNILSNDARWNKILENQGLSIDKPA